MRQDKNIMLGDVPEILKALGAEVRERRKSRCLSVDRVCLDAHISRHTLILIEKGSPNVSIGLYFDVIYVPGYRRHLWDLANAKVHQPLWHGPDKPLKKFNDK